MNSFPTSNHCTQYRPQTVLLPTAVAGTPKPHQSATAPASVHVLLRALTIVREPDRLVLHAEDCVIVLEQAPADEIQPVDRVDERLTRFRLPRERPHVQLAARDRQVERLARRVRERQRQL